MYSFIIPLIIGAITLLIKLLNKGSDTLKKKHLDDVFSAICLGSIVVVLIVYLANFHDPNTPERIRMYILAGINGLGSIVLGVFSRNEAILITQSNATPQMYKLRRIRGFLVPAFAIVIQMASLAIGFYAPKFFIVLWIYISPYIDKSIINEINLELVETFDYKRLFNEMPYLSKLPYAFVIVTIILVALIVIMIILSAKIKKYERETWIRSRKSIVSQSIMAIIIFFVYALDMSVLLLSRKNELYEVVFVNGELSVLVFVIPILTIIIIAISYIFLNIVRIIKGV